MNTLASPGCTPRTSACLLPVALGALAVTPLVCFAYATLAEPFRPVLRRRTVTVPASWPALSILHLSDLHVRTGADRLFEAQRVRLRGLAPDLAVVTGDLCESVADVDRTIELLREVRPRFGTFVVLGNHEHDAHRPPPASSTPAPAWSRLLNRALEVVAPDSERQPGQARVIAGRLANAGIRVLVNRGVRLHLGGGTLWIAGCDSAWAGGADMPAAMRGRRPAEGCLVLAHEPELALPAQAFGADLILAGHSHGGQVRLPLLGTPYTHRVDRRIEVACGFQRIGHSLLHVSAGLGQTIPLRFGCPPEAVWLECVPLAAAARRGSSSAQSALRLAA